MHVSHADHVDDEDSSQLVCYMWFSLVLSFFLSRRTHDGSLIAMIDSAIDSDTEISTANSCKAWRRQIVLHHATIATGSPGSPSMIGEDGQCIAEQRQMNGIDIQCLHDVNNASG